MPPHTHKHSYARTILHFRNPRQYTITVANTKVDAGDGDRTGDLRRARLERYHCANLTRLRILGIASVSNFLNFAWL